MKKFLTVILSVLLLVGCGATGETSSEKTKVVVGLMGTDSKLWNHIKSVAAEENIDIELKFFDSYPLVNRALENKELDINAFQHYSYLEKEVEELGYNLSVIGETVYAPLGLYSKLITDINQVKDGDKVAIPDDVTNGGRALLLLESCGLIEVDDAAGFTPTLKDVTKKIVNIEIVEMTASVIPTVLGELPLAAINSGIATDAGFIPTEDAIVLESVANDNPYINVIVSRTEDKDNAAYKRIVEIYHTDEVKDIIADETKGSSIPVWK